jgi:hypothetical protein
MSVVTDSLTCDISTTMPEEDEFPINALPHSLSRIPIQYHKCSFQLYGVKDQISHLQGFEAAFYARSCIRTSENSPFHSLRCISQGWSDWMPAVRIELRDSSSASRATPVW